MVLYKVTPMLAPPAKEQQPSRSEEGGTSKPPRKRRKSAVYDFEGREVLITLKCLKCGAMKPLTMFGLRKMGDGAIRNQPWCRTCRSGASSSKAKPDESTAEQLHDEVAAHDTAAE